MSPENFVRQGYMVELASNGGFTVKTRLSDYAPGEVAAFSNYRDLLEWLTTAHMHAAHPVVTAAGGNVPAAE